MGKARFFHWTDHDPAFQLSRKSGTLKGSRRCEAEAAMPEKNAQDELATDDVIIA